MDSLACSCDRAAMRSILKTSLAVLVFAVVCSTARAGEQVVIVNGVQLPNTAPGASATGRAVRPGRYWLDPYGNAGFEGGPPLVNLAQARARGAQGYAAWNNNTAFGNWGGDGNCSYYNNPDGDSILIGDC